VVNTRNIKRPAAQRAVAGNVAAAKSYRGYLERIQRAGQLRAPVAAEAGSRGRLLVEAIKLFASHGYDACAVRDLARAAGLRAPAIYNHYGSKSDILVAAVDHMISQFYATVFASPQPKEARELLLQILRRHALYGMAHQTMSKAAYLLLNPDFMARVMPDSHRRRIAGAMAEYISILAELLDEVVGIDGNLDSTLRAILTHDLVDQSAARYEPKRGRDPESEADQYLLLVSRMVGLNAEMSTEGPKDSARVVAGDPPRKIKRATTLRPARAEG
jgi:AcrR family transcriptional regulator